MSKIANVELLDWLRLQGVHVFRDEDEGYYAEILEGTQPKERFLNAIRASIRAGSKEKP